MSDQFFKDQLKVKAWEHIDNSETGDLTGFGSHTDPKTGNTYRIRAVSYTHLTLPTTPYV